MTTKDAVFRLTLTDAEYDQVRAIALKEGRSYSGVLRELVQAGLEQRTAKEDSTS